MQTLLHYPFQQRTETMLGWLRPRCPIDPRDKVWIDLRMRWFSDQFGLDRLRRTEIVAPSDPRLPADWQGTEAQAAELFRFVVDHMQVGVGPLELTYFDDATAPHLEVSSTARRGAAGLYEFVDGTHFIRIHRSNLADPQRLLATVAHELSHAILLGENRLSADETDHEETTDLLPAFLGLGVFAANATIRSQANLSIGWEYWSINKQGYLPSSSYGYALALCAWVRGEERPAWAAELRRDAREVFEKSARYLRKTSDAIFRPDNATATDAATVSDLSAELTQRHIGFRVHALWKLAERGPTAEAATRPVRNLLHDADYRIRTEAAGTWAAIARDPLAAAVELLPLFHDARGEVRIAALSATAKLAARSEPVAQHGEVVDETILRLDDPNSAVVQWAVRAIASFGPHASEAGPRLVKLLKRAMIDCDHAAEDNVLHTLTQVVPDSQAYIAEHLHDEELHARAHAALTAHSQTT